MSRDPEFLPVPFASDLQLASLRAAPLLAMPEDDEEDELEDDEDGDEDEDEDEDDGDEDEDEEDDEDDEDEDEED